MKSRKVVYIAHPLSAPTREGIEENRRNAAKWAAWAALQGVAPSCSWIVLTGEFEETPENRAMGLECDIALAIQADEIWLVGGRVSSGMRIEADAATAAGVVLVNLTDMGRCPPALAQHEAAARNSTDKKETTR